MDEAKVKVEGCQVYAWVARNLTSKEAVASSMSHARSNLTALCGVAHHLTLLIREFFGDGEIVCAGPGPYRGP